MPTPLALLLTILPALTLPVDTVKLLPVIAAPVIAPVAEINPAVLRLPPCTLPVTLKLLSVPTEVIFVCAAVVNVPTILVPDRLPEVILPVTAKLVNVPTDVMLACAAVVTVAAVVAAPVNAPTNVVLVTLVKPATVVTVEPNVNAVLPNVTAEFANLACASVPELMFVALMLVTLAPDPLSVAITLPPVMLPVTLKLPKVPTEVILV